MKSHRFLVLCAVILLLAGCASLFTCGVRTQDGQIDRATALLQQELSTRSQTEDRLWKLQTAYDRLAGENEHLRQEQAGLTAKHEVALKRLDNLSDEVHQLCKSAANNSRLQRPENWHQRLIAANQPIYGEIRSMLHGLTEDEFPTVRTWYGNIWRQLTQPFIENQFPAESQRDQLVQLLGDIMQAEHRRMLALGEQPILTIANGQENSIAGYCLGPQWERLVTNLQSLHY